jgi:phytanoyl-CoA hydroxylase
VEQKACGRTGQVKAAEVKLTQSQLAMFGEQGYVVVDDVLEPSRDIDPILAEYDAVLSSVVDDLEKMGAVFETYDDLPFLDRLIALSVASKRSLGRYFSPTLPEAPFKPDEPMHQGPGVFSLLTSESLLDVVESVIGPEVYVHPLHHLRLKLPKRAVMGEGDGLVGHVPWHQDTGVLLAEADDVNVLTVWVPLTDARRENGALEVVPGSHHGRLLRHCPADAERGLGPAIPEAGIFGPRTAVPVEVGSILLLHRRLIHRALENVTENEVRLSFDLRFQPVGQPTGRELCPGFVARSAGHPEAVLRNFDAWRDMWLEARTKLGLEGVETNDFFRWTDRGPGC